MAEPRAESVPSDVDGDDTSLLVIGSVLLRRRRLIGGLLVGGALLGLTFGFMRTRSYVSSVTLIPRGAETGGSSGLALAASQFGLRVPPGGGGWGAPIYLKLLRSRALLEPIAADTVTVVEEGGRRVAVMELLEVSATSPARRSDLTVRQLESFVSANEDKSLGAVKFSVATRWPSFSLWLAEQLVKGVNRFNLDTRKSQAAEERRFVETQAGEAERALRAAEDRLQSFLQRNRVIGSPEVVMERDRLGRDVALRQQIYTSLLQDREEARIREVRDTPVITLLEEPRLPLFSEPRKVAQKVMLGGLGGGALGVMVAFLLHGVAAARRTPSDEAREFFGLVRELTPRFLRKGGR